MAKHRRHIAERAATQAKEGDLRRLASWNDNLHKYGEPTDWAKKSKLEIIDYLQCQFIISTSWSS